VTRVLFLTCHLPYPAISGGRLRELELLRRLASRFDVEVCAVTKTFGEDLANASVIERLGVDVEVFPAAETAGPSGAGYLPHQVLRHQSGEAADYLARAVDDFDVVHVEGFYLMHLLPDPCPTPVVLVEQNVECRLWLQRADSERGEERTAYVLEYARTREAERRAWVRADRCAALTEEDRAAMLEVRPELDVAIVPDGVDHVPAAESSALAEEPTVVFVANFGYEPNLDAAVHLCRDVLPLVAEAVPDVELTLVGNSCPPVVRELAAPKVTITGRVPAVEPFLDAAHVVAVPLRIGGGVKVKMLEALRRGKAIVTTTIGTQGLAGVEECVRVEDDPVRFAAAIVDVLQRPEERARLERAASAYAAGLPTWDDSAAALSALWLAVTHSSVESVVTAAGFARRGSKAPRSRVRPDRSHHGFGEAEAGLRSGVGAPGIEPGTSRV
jgi:glycosyltransferase involved in cell wall biosynthesis